MRGASTASWSVMPSSRTWRIVCRTAEMILGPPGDPRTRTGRPGAAGSSTIVGHIDDQRRFPAAAAVRGAQRRQRTLPAGDGVRAAADEAELIRDAAGQGEVVHLVVQEHARPG